MEKVRALFVFFQNFIYAPCDAREPSSSDELFDHGVGRFLWHVVVVGKGRHASDIRSHFHKRLHFKINIEDRAAGRDEIYFRGDEGDFHNLVVLSVTASIFLANKSANRVIPALRLISSSDFALSHKSI